MSIQSEITRISGNVADALDAITAKGVTVPAGSSSDDLADLISQISGGGQFVTNWLWRDTNGVVRFSAIDPSEEQTYAESIIVYVPASSAAIVGQAIVGQAIVG